MDLYSLISCIPMSTNRFTQKWDCFQSQSDNYFFLKLIMKSVKTSGKMLLATLSWAYFYEAKFFGQYKVLRLQDALIIIISRRNKWMFWNFLHIVMAQTEDEFETNFFL